MHQIKPIPYRADARVYFERLRELHCASWLDSGGRGRYDILVAEPARTLVTRGECTEIWDEQGIRYSTLSPFELIRAELGAIREHQSQLPFVGGALGYWGYELGGLRQQAGDATAIPPEMAVGIYDCALILDHEGKQGYLLSVSGLPGGHERLCKVERALHDMGEKPAQKFVLHGRIQSNFTKKRYRDAFDRVLAYIREGDCYQVNLAQKFEVPAAGDAYQGYLTLRKLSPAPYSAFLDMPDMQVLSVSPESFLRVREGSVSTTPIKGTRARSKDAALDEARKHELAANSKDRAENLMIVDLLRNDLGKSCIPGSIRVSKLFGVESYSNVHHLESTIVGDLAPGREAVDVLRDSFPGGSITGAPKQRAMEIIAELEPDSRSVYCGAIGYLSFDGSMEVNVAIRTMLYSHGKINCWAGGGIVADSQCESEYQETLDKASAMLEMLQRHGAELA